MPHLRLHAIGNTIDSLRYMRGRFSRLLCTGSQLFGRSSDLLSRRHHLPDEIMDLLFHGIEAQRELTELIRRFDGQIIHRQISSSQFCRVRFQPKNIIRDSL